LGVDANQAQRAIGCEHNQSYGGGAGEQVIVFQSWCRVILAI
jgi:hypothetical protein